jgi:triosephosphate isomerase (TIM)
MAPRRPVLAGNWKMNHAPDDAAAFFREFLPLRPPADDRSVVFFPPALAFAAAREATAERRDVLLGVQNVHWEAEGAFTGETSAPTAAAAGAALALVGHSERRHVFGETAEETARKVRAVLDAGMAPLLCVGETLEERRAGRAEAVVAEQLAPVLAVLRGDEAASLLVAYEPVWAIGTGETASPADAGAMHRAVRARLAEAFGEGAARRVPILYGGSVKPENAVDILAEPGVDGVLVGGASLEPRGFARICDSVG